ncbi:unnamed protein product [Amoebophrya sp. A25]|nr:unnamed protein product [Amoebophrya sp. A25]|eukprot:GSA25T00025500001.1
MSSTEVPDDINDRNNKRKKAPPSIPKYDIRVCDAFLANRSQGQHQRRVKTGEAGDTYETKMQYLLETTLHQYVWILRARFMIAHFGWRNGAPIRMTTPQDHAEIRRQYANFVADAAALHRQICKDLSDDAELDRVLELDDKAVLFLVPECTFILSEADAEEVCGLYQEEGEGDAYDHNNLAST